MRLNEYEISFVSDTASPEVQKLKDSQTKSKSSMTLSWDEGQVLDTCDV